MEPLNLILLRSFFLTRNWNIWSFLQCFNRLRFPRNVVIVNVYSGYIAGLRLQRTNLIACARGCVSFLCSALNPLYFGWGDTAVLLKGFWYYFSLRTRVRPRLKCDDTRAETRFRVSAKRTSPFKSAGGRQFSRLLAAEVCTSAVVMLDTTCFEVVWRVLATHSIRQFPLPFPSRASRVPSHFNWTLQHCGDFTWTGYGLQRDGCGSQLERHETGKVVSSWGVKGPIHPKLVFLNFCETAVLFYKTRARSQQIYS